MIISFHVILFLYMKRNYNRLPNMKKLLSLPPNLVECFHEIENADRDEWFCTSDPIGCKLGSGGGTTWLMKACMDYEGAKDINKWLAKEKRILLHAGGQSRRLPSYAPSGKILTPIPVFRWGRGQKLTQNLLSLQLPLYEHIMEKAPESLHTLIASGDIYIRADKPLQKIPEADVVCYGLWVDPSLAKNHGVFIMNRQTPDKLDFMLQKPSLEKLGELTQHYLYLMDIGVWLLSDKAMKLIMERSAKGDGIGFYDMYSEFGPSLGEHPEIKDSEINKLKVAILPLPGGKFYHYGTSREMISSTLAVQNLVKDQREITLHKVKPHPAMFTQNSSVNIPLNEYNSNLWIENSYISPNWKINNKHIITGVPENDWHLSLPSEICVDVVPIEEDKFVARPYGFNDAFKGSLCDTSTIYQSIPVISWLTQRGLDPNDIEGNNDLQSARIFPVCNNQDELGKVLEWMINSPSYYEGENIWKKAKKISADEISSFANLKRLTMQRRDFRKLNWKGLSDNYRKSVFYQLNLLEAAQEFSSMKLNLPDELPSDEPLNIRISDAMFRSKTMELSDNAEAAKAEEDIAFQLMRDGIKLQDEHVQSPRLSVYADQIVWGRSPVRIDLAGGWTDTPPYCLNEGGNVINLAINLNGQPPLQVYVKPCKEFKIILRSIDLGAMETVSTYDDLYRFNIVGSPFSIPKAALVLSGFYPSFCNEKFKSLEEQLKAFGAGIEVTLLSAIPAGSGLGTSSILAATVLGALNKFCGLNWDKHEICNKTLILEQLLTTGGGWQDQYGGILPGIKLLQTEAGWKQSPLVRWLPGQLFTDSEYKNCHLLYYTGITRTAKSILAEIVKGMFLNSTEHLDLLRQMKQHTLDMNEAIMRNNYEEMARLVGVTWKQNQKLDSGTNPPAVQAIINKIDDLCLGYKLPGAGGGGYLYMAAKDEEAAARIKRILNKERINDKARFVDMTLSDKGFEVSLS